MTKPTRAQKDMHERTERILQLYEQGITSQQISVRLGVSKELIRRALKDRVKIKTNPELVQRNKRRTKISDQDAVKILHRYDNGDKVLAMAAEHRVSEMTIRYAIQRARAIQRPEVQ